MFTYTWKLNSLLAYKISRYRSDIAAIFGDIVSILKCWRRVITTADWWHSARRRIRVPVAAAYSNVISESRPFQCKCYVNTCCCSRPTIAVTWADATARFAPGTQRVWASGAKRNALSWNSANPVTDLQPILRDCSVRLKNTHGKKLYSEDCRS